PLVDINDRHDLNARNQSGMELLGRRRFFLQQTVDPVAQLNCLLEGNEVYVAGPLAQGGRDNQVDQINDSGLIGHHLDIVQVAALHHRGLLGAEALDHRFNRHLVAFGYPFEDLRCGHENFLYFQSAEQPDVIDDALVAQLGGADLQRAVIKLQGQHEVALNEVARQCADRVSGYGDFGKTRGS